MKNKLVLGIFLLLTLTTSSVFASMVENSRQGSPAISAISHPETSTLEQRSLLGFELRFLNFIVRSGIIYTDPFGLEIQVALDQLAKNPIWQLKYGWRLQQAYNDQNWGEVESIGREIETAGQNPVGEWCGLDRVAANIFLDPELFGSDLSYKTRGPAKPGYQHHHIVEQRQVNRTKFGNSAIDSVRNVVEVPTAVNQAINAFYSSKQLFTSGQTVRDWLASKTFTEQFEYGKSILDKALGGKSLP